MRLYRFYRRTRMSHFTRANVDPDLYRHIVSLCHNELIKCCPECVKTHWGRVTHTCVCKPSIICPDDELSPGTTTRLLLIRNKSQWNPKRNSFSTKKMHLKMLSAKLRQFCLAFNASIKRLNLMHAFLKVWQLSTFQEWLNAKQGDKPL